jgi:hypothetical protein
MVLKLKKNTDFEQSDISTLTNVSFNELVPAETNIQHVHYTTYKSLKQPKRKGIYFFLSTAEFNDMYSFKFTHSICVSDLRVR